jgi:hypothetical protein
MHTPSLRFFVTLAFAPLVLSLSLSHVQAQQTTDIVDTGELIDLQSLTETGFILGKQASRPAQMGVEILSPDARKLLMQLDESKPEEADSSIIRNCLERLRKLQATYTTTGRLDEAFVVRESIEEYLARRAGIEPDPGNMTSFRNEVGQTHTFRVIGRRRGPVWGSQPYTDDSDLGTAAVHAGLLRDGQRGVVKVTVLPGQPHYDGGEANGIASSSYETWQGSYMLAPGATFTGAHDGTMPEEAKKLVDELTQPESKVSAARLWQGMDTLQTMLETAQKAEKLDEALALREGIRALIIKLVGARPDPGSLTSLRKEIGKSFYFVVTGRVTGSIWGSEVYTDDSDLGTVAVHAGLLREGQTGIIKVTMRMGFEGYAGSESHGVVSGDYGPWQGSYRVSAFHLPPR